MIDQLKEKKIMILGLGREGLATYRVLRKIWSEKELALADRIDQDRLSPELKKIFNQDKKTNWRLGEKYLEDLNSFEIVLKTPGIPFNLPEIVDAQSRGVVFTSETEVFLQLARERIIGLTGTKGKSTTATLVHHLLKGQLKVELIGNMGVAAFSCWEKARDLDIWFVYELSSHQLDQLKISPHISIMLNLMPDHLDHFSDLESYYRAKANIFLHQKKHDWILYNNQDKVVAKMVGESLAQKMPYSQEDEGSSYCFWKNQEIYYRPQPGAGAELVLSKNDLRAINPVTKKNLLPAILVAKMMKVGNEEIAQKLKTFRPPAHRLEFIGEYQGISFYNDSAATIPEATIAALESFRFKVSCLIVGGSEKGTDYSDLAKRIAEGEVDHLICFPITGLKIAEVVSEYAKTINKKGPEFKMVETMEEAIEYVYRNVSPGGNCILSPASASFTNFNNYQDRGNSFVRWVKEINEKGRSRN